MTNKTVVCPECGEILEVELCAYMDYEDGTVTREADGVCPKCQKYYTWTEFYKLVNMTGLKEITELYN